MMGCDPHPSAPGIPREIASLSRAPFALRKGQCVHPGSKSYNSKAEIAGAGVGGIGGAGTYAVSITVGIVT